MVQFSPSESGNQADQTNPATDEAVYPSNLAATYGLGLLFVAYVFSFIDRQILSLLVGPIREDFGISDFEFSLLQGAAFSLLYTVVGLPLGRLADRYSRRVIISGSVLFWSLMTCACGLSKNFTQLFIFRMGVGAGEAGLAPSAYSVITDSFKPAHLGYAMSFYKVAVSVGSGLALVIGGVVFELFNKHGAIETDFFGVIQPWQATMIAIGLPGFLVSLLLLTMQEPSRKGVTKDSEQEGEVGYPIKTVFAYLAARKRVYLTLFLGASMKAIAGYGNGAWYPEFLHRKYEMSKGDIGMIYGLIYLSAGSIGIMLGPWIANKLADRGYKDAYIRTIFIACIGALPFSVIAPLAGDATITLVLLWFATFFGSAYLGLMAASFQVITPNRMRGQTTAIYIFITNIIGMALGTSIIAIFTDFVFQDEGALHYSIATVSIIFYPLAIIFFWFCMPAYRDAIDESSQWQKGGAVLETAK